MRCAKGDALAAVEAARIGVFAFTGRDGRPRACPVTPYLHAGHALVSSTLAFTAKVGAVRDDPAVALLAGGWLLRGEASVDIDLSSRTFDTQVRDQELRKYPPSRQLLSIPAHRRLLWWYVGRSTIRIPIADPQPAPGSDRVTLTLLDERRRPTVIPLDETLDVQADELPVPDSLSGPGCILVHEEDEAMADLRQLTLHGSAEGGVFCVERRAGSLAPTNPSTLDQLRTLRYLARQARTKRTRFRRWIDDTRSSR